MKWFYYGPTTVLTFKFFLLSKLLRENRRALTLTSAHIIDPTQPGRQERHLPGQDPSVDPSPMRTTGGSPIHTSNEHAGKGPRGEWRREIEARTKEKAEGEDKA